MDISGSTLSSELGGGNITVQSSGGNTSGFGNVNVNDIVSWTAPTTLTLTAANNVNVNANVTATSPSSGLAINANSANGADQASGMGGINIYNSSINIGGAVALSGVVLNVGTQTPLRPRCCRAAA